MKWLATLAVAAAAVGLSSAVDPCPSPFTNYDPESVLPKCLLFLTSYDTWQSMLNFCEMLSGSLAVVDGDLHNIVNRHIMDDPELSNECTWIGGTDQHQEGHWVWEYDGSEIPLISPHWDPCEPEPDGGSDENYLAICPDMYYYKDYPGARQFHAICQYFF